ncbi:tape measure protein [Virgibacillus halophilus]|uniref:Tape measure protein n=1 Tax=Tigheibacillus halophilus TaxID=361280 RepID=A0ABU5C7Z2_9BACI|nr:tape measure protein [Virgibacillus halophilus]
MSTNFSSVGKTLTNFGNGLQQASQKVGNLGKSLTKKITLPAAGAATAIGGITAALGWKRLVGLDSAQAQLKGLGYNTKEVGRISKQVTKAIDGGMTTMAEGTSVAAGALAAGVKEGAELERYIKLVGDAAVGANRPVGDMAQIFNRVQGSGKLMTQELNMIEDGMPGFAQAMAKNLNVSQEEFRKMVTDGKVNSKKFLDVMEDFAGGMASAYSDSWQGMVANTKAYIGIIGENLLGGVFEKSKESIAEFIEFLKSDEVIAWAQKVGKTLGVMFSNVVDKVQSAIQWFANLSKSQQSMIMKFGAVALAAGPILVVLGTLGGYCRKVVRWIGRFDDYSCKSWGRYKGFWCYILVFSGTHRINCCCDIRISCRVYLRL